MKLKLTVLGLLVSTLCSSQAILDDGYTRIEEVGHTIKVTNLQNCPTRYVYKLPKSLIYDSTTATVAAGDSISIELNLNDPCGEFRLKPLTRCIPTTSACIVGLNNCAILGFIFDQVAKDILPDGSTQIRFTVSSITNVEYFSITDINGKVWVAKIPVEGIKPGIVYKINLRK